MALKAVEKIEKEKCKDKELTYWSLEWFNGFQSHEKYIFSNFFLTKLTIPAKIYSYVYVTLK